MGLVRTGAGRSGGRRGDRGGAGVVAAPHREGGEGKGDDGERTEPVAGGVGLHEPNRRTVANRGHGTRRSSYELLAEERAGILGP